MIHNKSLTMGGLRRALQGLTALGLLFAGVIAYGYDDDYSSYSSRPKEPKYNTVYKCHDAKGNVTMSNFACPNDTKMDGREDIKVREHKYSYNRYSSSSDWRYSQYNRPDYGASYRRAVLNNRPNTAEINSKYREAERQAEWDSWKNKDHTVTDAKLSNLEAQRKAETNRGNYLR
jgi:hypothetical protein